jgi:cytochrome c-type biogenesis protein CcmH/NrfG
MRSKSKVTATIIILLIISALSSGAVETTQAPGSNADAFYSRVLKDDPGNPTANIYMGDKAYKDGKFDDAVKYFQAALQTEPNNTEAMFKLARTYALNGKMDDAAPLYERVLALDPAHVDAHYGVALVYDARNEFE